MLASNGATPAPAAIRPISFGDSTRTHPSGSADLPLPTESLMWSVGSSIENFLAVGRIWGQLVNSFTPEHSTVLDIGCGCGRVARFLIDNLRIDKYIGFDVIRENIGWCRQHLEPHWNGRSELYWFDLYSAEYNPLGAVKANQLVFPCESGAADIVFAGSLFTHLLEPDAVHYLEEIRRVLSPRGKAILSVHTQPPPGSLFFGTERRIDIDPSYFIQLAAKAGLREEGRQTPHDPTLQMDIIFGCRSLESVATEHENSSDISRLRLETLAAELVTLQKTSISEVDAFRAEITGTQEEVARLQEEVTRLQGEAAMLQQERSRFHEELLGEQQRRQATEEIRAAIEQSVSWRVTRPARSCMHFLRYLLAGRWIVH